MTTATSAYIVDAMQSVVDRLAAAGIRVYDDAVDVNPPCVLVLPPTLHFRFNKGDYSADFAVLLISSNTVRRAALAELSELIEATQTALGFMLLDARPVEAYVPDQSHITASYEVIWTERHSMRKVSP